MGGGPRLAQFRRRHREADRARHAGGHRVPGPVGRVLRERHVGDGHDRLHLRTFSLPPTQPHATLRAARDPGHPRRARPPLQAVKEITHVCFDSLEDAWTGLYPNVPSNDIPSPRDFPDVGLNWARAGSILQVLFGVSAAVLFSAAVFSGNRALCAIDPTNALTLLVRDLARPAQSAAFAGLFAAGFGFVANSSFGTSPYIIAISGGFFEHIPGNVLTTITVSEATPASTALNAASIGFALASFLIILVPADVGMLAASLKGTSAASDDAALGFGTGGNSGSSAPYVPPRAGQQAAGLGDAFLPIEG
jgi:hypothetical protein